MSIEPYKPLYKAMEAAEVLRVTKGTMYKLIESGAIPHLKINNSIKIRGTDLERFIENFPIEPVSR